MGVEEYNKQQLERLREYKVPFDQEAMWAAMQKKKKRRGAFIFFTMALVALAIVFLTFGVYSYFKLDEHKENLHSEKISINTEILNEKEKGTKEATITEDSENILNADSPIELDANEQQSSNDQYNKTDTKNNIVKTTENLITSKKVFNTKKKSTVNTNINSTITPNLNNSTEENRNAMSSKEIEDNSSKITKDQSATLKKESEVNLFDLRPLKPSDFPFLESLKNRPLDTEKLEMTTPPIVEITEAPKSRFHIGAYGGAGYLFRQITQDGVEIQLDDEILEEVSAGLELKYQVKLNVFLRSGIEYWHATDRRESSTFSISNLNELEDPSEFGLTAADKGIIVQSTYSKKHSIYQSLNIPLLIGYNTNNPSWNLFVEAGIMYNILNTSKGELPFESNEAYQIGSRNQISPIAGVGLSYSPSSKFELYTRINWRGKQSVTNSESITNQQYGAMRGQLGIRIGI